MNGVSGDEDRAFFLVFGIPLILADLLAGPLIARAGRGEVIRATAIK